MTFVNRMSERAPAIRHYAENRGWIFMLLVTIVAYVFTVTIQIQTSRGIDFFGEDFESLENVENTLELDITPTTATWQSSALFLYVSLLFIALIALALICHPNFKRGGFLYFCPPFWPALTFFTLTIAFLFLSAFSITYALLLPQWAFVFAALVTLFVTITLASAMNGLEKHGQELIDDGLGGVVITFIVNIENGLSFFVAWAAILTTYVFGQVLVYEIGTVSVIDAGSTVLAILGFDLLVFFFLQLFIYKKKLRFLFGPYLAYIWFHSGVLVANWDTEERNAIFALVMTLTAAVFLFTAVILSAHRTFYHPIFIWPECSDGTDDIPPAYDDSTSVTVDDDANTSKAEEAEKDKPQGEDKEVSGEDASTVEKTGDQ